ncbi:MAG: bacillithiol biosynthesis deacetylase BshB1 [Bacteroidia bacterium]|nr:bacillithiol biosynthesis deacetylase BshB1 [Bacteroidia bacterium]
MDLKLDVLVMAPHPDDVELGCGGTIAKMVAEGKKLGVIDLTRGELGSRGSAEIRDREAADAAEILGLSIRENLSFRDGFFTHDDEHKLAIIRKIRKYKPEILIAGAPEDRHPDHGRATKLIRDAAFLSGLLKIQTEEDGMIQEHWRPKRIFHFIQDYNLTPSFVVDISEYWDQKKASILAYSSQFFNPDYESDEPETYISNKGFFQFLEARARNMGHLVGAEYGEGFISETPLLVQDPMDLI